MKKENNKENTVKQLIINELDLIHDKYVKSADEINSDYNRENDQIDAYKGRQIFELLQNADDEAINNTGEVRIEFSNNILRISNTGNKFSFKGFKSLLRTNNSPKRTRVNTIGYNGLGFRSILSWAESVKVITEEFAVEFSKDIAVSKLLELFQENNSLETDLKELNKDEYPIAILACPQFIEESPEKDYITTIEIKCKKEAVDDVKKQLSDLHCVELLFLRGLKEIRIIYDNVDLEFSKIPRIEGGNTIATIWMKDKKNPSNETKTDWYLFKDSGKISYEDEKHPGKIIQKDYELVLAYDKKNHTSGGGLYNFFKTDVSISFPAIIHGTFELGTDRSNLKKDNKANEELVKKLARFLITTSVELTKLNKKCDYEPLKLLFTTEIHQRLKENYHLDCLIKEGISNEAIFPTIGNNYISLSDNPKYCSQKFINNLLPESFSDLLQICDDKVINSYLQEKLDFYEYDSFVDRLNKGIIDNKYSWEDKCKLLNGIRLYSKINKEYTGKGLYLLEDTENKIVKEAKKIFPLPEAEEISKELPKWVEIKFLSPRMLSKLQETEDNANIRLIASYYTNFGLDEYDFVSLLRTVINQLEELKNNNEYKTNLKKFVYELLYWMFKVYDSGDKKNTIPQTIKIPVVCGNGGIYDSSNSYIGTSLGNKIGEKIVSVFSSNFVVMDDELFRNEDNRKIVEFLEWIGVKKFPRIKQQDVRYEDVSDYKKECLKKFDDEDLLKVGFSWHQDESYRKKDILRFRNHYVRANYPENFFEIINKVSSNDLVAWFLKDSSILQLIQAENELNSDSYIEILPLGKLDYRTIKNQDMVSYVRFILFREKWIDKGAGKESPCCCLENLELSNYVFYPNFDYSYILKEYGVSKKSIQGFLKLLGVADSFDELSTDVIYKVLNNLEGMDPDKKIAQTIYRKLKIPNIEDRFEKDKSKEYDDFKKNGRVLITQNGERRYEFINKVLYADNKLLSDSILHKLPMLCMDPRAGGSKIKKIFGVKPLDSLKISVKAEDNLSDLNVEFIKEYNDFLTYVIAYRLSTNPKNAKSDISLIHKTNIKLSSKVNVTYEIDGKLDSGDLKYFETIYHQKKKCCIYMCT